MAEPTCYVIVTEDGHGKLRVVGGLAEHDIHATYDSSLRDFRELGDKIIFSTYGLPRYDYDLFMGGMSKIQGKTLSESQSKLNSLINKIPD